MTLLIQHSSALPWLKPFSGSPLPLRLIGSSWSWCLRPLPAPGSGPPHPYLAPPFPLPTPCLALQPHRPPFSFWEALCSLTTRISFISQAWKTSPLWVTHPCPSLNIPSSGKPPLIFQVKSSPPAKMPHRIP